MEITIGMIRSLREKSGAGMMDCKRALAECGGDPAKAAAELRKSGWAAAAKKAERAALEGLVQAEASPDRGQGVMIEVNCGTDFAARNPEFRRLVLETANLIAAAGAGSPAEALTFRAADGLSVGEKLADLAAVLGENLVLRRCACWAAGANCAIGAYVHGDYLTGGKVGVLVEVTAARPEALANPVCAEILKDLALQTASLKPAYVRRADIPAEAAAKMQAGFLAEALAEGKPAAIAEKVARGRWEKYCQGACLLEQPYIKDPARTVGEWLEERSKEQGGAIVVTRLIRFEKGEDVGTR